MIRMEEENVPAGGRMFEMGQVCEAYTSRQFIVKFLAAPNEVLADMLLTAMYPDFQPLRILTFSFPERVATRLRLVQTATTKESIWSVAEFRVYDAGRELPRAPQWRLTARPNPWDVQLAFDNDPVTRWRTWERAMPGMRIEVDFGNA